METIHQTKTLTFIVRRDAYPCAGGSSTQLFIGLVNHGIQESTPVYLWVIAMAVCGDEDMAAPATVWAKNVQGFGQFLVGHFFWFFSLIFRGQNPKPL